MRINWKVRLKNRTWWLAVIPAVLLLVQAVAALFGYELQLGEIGNKLIDIVNAAFVVLALVGVVADPTTAGLQDSQRALSYDVPFDDENQPVYEITDTTREV